jgi:hypothetical protein
MARLYEDKIWTVLGNIPITAKSLYLYLWSEANSIGIVPFDLGAFSRDCGIQFTMADIDALGNRVIPVNDNQELLLSRFMKISPKALSRKCSGHDKIWALIHARWGDTRENGSEPFIDAWEELGIRKWAPEIKEEYHGDGPKPKWLKDHLARAEEAKKVKIPPSWEPTLRNEVEYYLQFRYDFAVRVVSQSAMEDWDWRLSDAEKIINTANSWLKRGATQNQISETFFNAGSGKYKVVHPPKSLILHEQQKSSRSIKAAEDAAENSGNQPQGSR